MTHNEFPETSEIIASALRLPMTDRITLANAVLESMEDSQEQISQSDIDASWSDEIARRVKEIESGKLNLISSTVLWERIGGKPNA